MSQQRDPWGRFLPGHNGGPGRPKQTHDPAYRTIVEEVVSHEDWRAILEKLKQSALRGDREALKFLAGYLLGRPGLAEPSEDDTASSFPMAPLGPPPPMPGVTLKQLSQQLQREVSKFDRVVDHPMHQPRAEKKRK